jgi:phage shock protein A
MGTIFGAKMNKVLDRAENPNETLDYSYQKQLELLQNVKRGLAELVTSKRRTQLEADRLRAESQKREDQAKQALAAGNEDLARQALQRKQLIDGQLSGMAEQIAGLEQQQQKLTDAQTRLQAKIEAFRSQKEVIKAQYTAATAQVKISEAATGIGEEFADVGMAVQRAQDKTQQMQARASAMDELMDSGALQDYSSDSDDIDRKLSQLTSGSQVDNQLATLRQQMGLPSPEAQPQLIDSPAEPQPRLTDSPAKAEAPSGSQS